MTISCTRGQSFKYRPFVAGCLLARRTCLSDIRNLSTHLGFIRAAQDAPPAEILESTIADNPDDLDARYRLGALKINQDKYEAAMQQLLEIVRHDSGFRNRAALDGMSAIFAMLGEDDERVQRYRELLNRTAP